MQQQQQNFMMKASGALPKGNTIAGNLGSLPPIIGGSGMQAGQMQGLSSIGVVMGQTVRQKGQGAVASARAMQLQQQQQQQQGGQVGGAGNSGFQGKARRQKSKPSGNGAYGQDAGGGTAAGANIRLHGTKKG
jgi:hypothetical protein